MIEDMAHLIAASMERVKLSSTHTAKARKGVISALIDPILPSLGLADVRALARQGHSGAVEQVILAMSQAQLGKVSRAWNPNRKITKDVVMRDLQMELLDLVGGRSEPAPKPVKTPAKRRASALSIAAE